jgi:hypothetical protein
MVPAAGELSSATAPRRRGSKSNMVVTLVSTARLGVAPVVGD